MNCFNVDLPGSGNARARWVPVEPSYASSFLIDMYFRFQKEMSGPRARSVPLEPSCASSSLI